MGGVEAEVRLAVESAVVGIPVGRGEKRRAATKERNTTRGERLTDDGSRGKFRRKELKEVHGVTVIRGFKKGGLAGVSGEVGVVASEEDSFARAGESN